MLSAPLSAAKVGSIFTSSLAATAATAATFDLNSLEEITLRAINGNLVVSLLAMLLMVEVEPAVVMVVCMRLRGFCMTMPLGVLRTTLHKMLLVVRLGQTTTAFTGRLVPDFEKLGSTVPLALRRTGIRISEPELTYVVAVEQMLGCVEITTGADRMDEVETVAAMLHRAAVDGTATGAVVAFVLTTLIASSNVSIFISSKGGTDINADSNDASRSSAISGSSLISIFESNSLSQADSNFRGAVSG